MPARLLLITALAACSAGEPCPSGNADCMCVFVDCPCIGEGEAGVCTSMASESEARDVDAGAGR